MEIPIGVLEITHVIVGERALATLPQLTSFAIAAISDQFGFRLRVLGRGSGINPLRLGITIFGKLLASMT